MGELAASSGLDLASHEIAADDIERSGPPPDPDPIALAQRFEPLVVTNGMAIVLGAVPEQVDSGAEALEAGQSSVVVDDAIADGAAGKLDVGARPLTEGQAASTAECRLAPAS